MLLPLLLRYHVGTLACVSINSSIDTECNPAFFPPLANGICARSVPRAVVYPRTTAQVAEAVRYARSAGMELSYMGGGHSYVCESSKPNSLQISMRNFKQITVHEDEDTVTLGTGLLFTEVLRVLPPENYSIAHGGCRSVGVGGFFLHGGIHAPATRLIGTGNSTVVGMTVVTANGTIMHLNAASPHRDLWDGMRVDGSAFAIATSLTVRFLREPEATSFVFLFSMGERQFARTWGRVVKRTEADGLDADITIDGGGPQRITQFTRESLDQNQYLIQMSVRNNRAFNGYFVQMARAYLYLSSFFDLAILASMIPLNVAEDQSIGYDRTGGSWVSSMMCIDPSCPIEDIVYRLATHFREYAYTDAQWACWQVFSTTTSWPGQVCFEYNCPHFSVFARELVLLDEDIKAMCPAWTRSANVKGPNVPNSEYFTNYDELVTLKQKWDPHGVLNAI